MGFATSTLPFAPVVDGGESTLAPGAEGLSLEGFTLDDGEVCAGAAVDVAVVVGFCVGALAVELCGEAEDEVDVVDWGLDEADGGEVDDGAPVVAGDGARGAEVCVDDVDVGLAVDVDDEVEVCFGVEDAVDGEDVVGGDVFVAVLETAGSVVVDVDGSGFRRKLPEPSTAFSRAGFSDAFVSRVETCIVPVADRFGPRSSESPVFALAPVAPVDDVAAAPAVDASLVAAAVVAAVAASFFFASALASPRRRPAALGARS